MRLMFVYYPFEDQGSGLVIQGYSEAARAMGHEVLVYGRENPRIPLDYSLDLRSADAVVFIFEWTTELRYGDRLDLARLVASVPRERRVILDGDGNYNDPLQVEGDYNHRHVEASRRWSEICDVLTDKVCQPTLHPLRSNVIPFLFYAYNPAWELPLEFASKSFAMIYVGHSKFRWGPMLRVLRAVEPIRDQIGRLGLVGEGWGELPWWASWMEIEDTYYTDGEYLRRLDVEVMPAVPFTEVPRWMSQGVFNPVLLRPTFRHLRIVNPRMFETPAAGTIPLFDLEEEHLREIYGEAGVRLKLDGSARERVEDVLARPDHYAGVVTEMRQHLSREHSHEARLRQLIEIVEA
jgi:hypothetical protein